MLLRKADQGVRIYILLYWESKIIAGMDLGSEYAQTVLRHDNIEVLRHPDTGSFLFHPSTMLRWSHHEKVIVVDRSIAFVGGIDLCFGRWDSHNHELTDPFPPHPCMLESDTCVRSFPPPSDACVRRPHESTMRYSRWIGKDYGNTFLYGARTNLDKPMDDYVDRSKDPRMPWHDVACSVTGLPALDVAKHFIQRYNDMKPWYGDVHRLSPEDVLPDTVTHTPEPSGSNLAIQVLRSVDRWSAGQPHEASIHNAYLHAIQDAEYFIYIENQFFISSQMGTFMSVQNKIMSTLADRIYRAYLNNENFHAMIVMPLKPEFPEEWDKKNGRDLRSVSYWTYATIYSGKDSLFNRLKEKKIPAEAISQYFSVFGLRTHGSLNGNLVTEIVYVHSKLMIVDDRLAIIGSANINDRSMLGDRDSELAVIIQDNDLMEGKMNGQPYQVGQFSHSLRCHLLREHLGLLSEINATPMNVEDPLTEAFIKTISELAVKNTLIYEQVFHRRILPTNQVWNFEDLENWKSIPGLADSDVCPEKAEEELDKIQGSIVIFPSLFLKDVLKPSFLDYVDMYVDTRGRTKDLNFDDNTEGTFFA